jgi:hypothetical protein
MISSFVALSTTYSGVVTLPQSCSQAPIRNSRHSSSERKPNPASEPACTFAASSASIIASSGTRSQWPPVYGLFVSIAPATSLIIESISAFCASSRLKFSSATADCDASASMKPMIVRENGMIFPVSGSIAFTYWSTPLTSPLRGDSGIVIIEIVL